MARPLTRAPTAPASDAFLSRGEAWALVACQPLAQLSNQALLPSLGAMRDDLGLSYAELGWVVAASGLLAILLCTRASSAAQSLGASVVGTQRPDTGPPPWSALLSGGKALLAAYLATFIVFFCRNGMLNAVLPVLGADKLGIQPF